MLKKKTRFQEEVEETAAAASDRDEEESPYPDWDDGELNPDFDGGNGGISLISLLFG